MYHFPFPHYRPPTFFF
ncbi:hypothetical protein CAEBREN_06018 [Caenorhabditis brenneri]|uniref:Uncharacterized protein n=1 Tax=Caenorhabditis brenneri TaxID=135651 RepID=G0MCM1_CAEBE|nr:hypothetical protein CAEBREN_06018 [Caenorhabditis brenneri]